MAVSAKASSLSIEHLCDDLLLKILCRLPRISSYNCMYVCKRWLALTSTSLFHAESIQYQIKPFAPFARMILSNAQGCLFVHCSGDIHNRPLSFLPCFQEEGRAIEVLGFNQELLLCTIGESNYYLCNPITKECVSMPCAPPPPLDEAVQFGFLFHSFSRYIVVCFPLHADCDGCSVDPPCRLHLGIFSSETGEWKQVSVVCPTGYFTGEEGETRATVSSLVAHNNSRLFWWSASCEHMIVYDPYNIINVEKCWFVEKPSDMEGKFSDGFSTCFGVCRGSLRLCQVVGESRGLSYPKRLMVWKLKEFGECRWELQHNIDFKEMSYNKKPMYFKPIGFNPNDQDILYMRRRRNSITVSCNLRLKTIVDTSLDQVITMSFHPPFVADPC